MTTKQAADIIRMLLGYLKGEIEPPKQETIEEARAFEQQGYECLEMAIKALETVSCIKEKCAYCPHCENCDVDDETLEIKALEQQPCEDAISRKDMLAVFRQSNSLSQAWNGFEKLSPVTPKGKTGKWIYTGDYITDGMLKCTSCGYEHDVADRFLYCPNCGARMVSE